MVVYNLFLLLSHRDLIYLFFALLIVSLGLFQIARTGLGFQLFWPNLPQFNFMGFTYNYPHCTEYI